MKNAASLLLRIPARNIRRHARQSLAALISIAAGFGALNLFEGYMQNARHMFEVTYSQRLMYGDLLIQRTHAFGGVESGQDLSHDPAGETKSPPANAAGARKSTEILGGLTADPAAPLDEHDQNQIASILKELDETDTSVRFLNFSGLITNGDASSVFVGYAYDLESGEKMRGPNWRWNTLAGHPLTAHSPDDDQMLLGQGLGKMMDCRTTGPAVPMTPVGGYPASERPFQCAQPRLQISATTATGQMTAATLQVTGLIDAIYRELDLRNIVLSLPRAQSLLGTKDITFFTVRARPGVRPQDLVNDLNHSFAKQNLAFTAVPWKRHPYGEIYMQSMDFLGVFRSFTILVVLTIVMLSVFSSLSRLVQERTRETGTLRCLGFRPRQILALFVSEVLLLALSGCASGALVSIVLALGLNHAGILYQIGILSERVPFQIDITAQNLLIATLLLTALALIAGLIAITRALRLTIPESLASH